MLNRKNVIKNLWKDIDNQNWENLKSYFAENAIINWPNTNESFTVDQFKTVNKEYPGDWSVFAERLIEADDLVITVVKVQLKNENVSFHATSFFRFELDHISQLDEYWGEDTDPPEWRRAVK